MNSRGEGKGAVVGLIAVILISGFFVFRHLTQRAPIMAGTDWVCEECGQYFIAPLYGLGETPACPKFRCGGEVSMVTFFYDTKNNELVELYRMKFRPVGESGVLTPGDRLMKLPGGEWESFNERVELELEMQEGFVPAPPGSEYRK